MTPTSPYFVYYTKIKKLLNALVINENLTKRQVYQILKKLNEDLKRAEQEFKINLEKLQDDQVKHVNNLEIYKDIPDVQVNLKEIMFSEYASKPTSNSSSKKPNTIVKVVTVLALIEGIRRLVIKHTKSEMLGIQLSDDKNTKDFMKKRLPQIRRQTKQVQKIIIDKTKQEAHIKARQNNKEVEWVEFVTKDDERVDTVCKDYALKSRIKKYKPDEFPPEMVPQTHPNCRCSLKPHFKG